MIVWRMKSCCAFGAGVRLQSQMPRPNVAMRKTLVPVTVVTSLTKVSGRPALNGRQFTVITGATAAAGAAGAGGTGGAGAVTLTVTFAERAPRRAVMVVAPAAVPVIWEGTPPTKVTIPAGAADQSTSVVTSGDVPSLNVQVAVSCAVCPFGRLSGDGDVMFKAVGLGTPLRT
jgi:hypothetical protein